MNAAEAVKFFQSILQALYVLSALQLTAFMWPPQATVQDGDTFDFIVVGAGTAGSVVAARLAEDGKTKVLLIEAGGDPPYESTIPGLLIFLEKSHVDWNYTTEDDGVTTQCHKNHVENMFLGKMLGGTSSLNFILASETHYKDYNNWANIVNDNVWSWPEVLPYFIKATNLHNTDVFETPGKDYYGNIGPVGLTINSRLEEIYVKAIEETGNKIVLESNGNLTLGYAKAMYNIANGLRQSSAYSYLRPTKNYPNLQVLKNAVAKKILFDNNNNAVGIEVVTEDGKTINVKSLKEVIVSCGVVKSPQLLMLSGIGPKEDLESNGIEVISDLPVGKNYHDHVSTILIHNLTKLESTLPRDPNEYPANTFIGYVNPDKTKDYPEYSTTNWINYSPFLLQFCVWTYGIEDEICENMFKSNMNQMVWTVITNLHPKSRGEILLRSANYEDAPIVKTGYYSNEEDLEDQVKYIEDFLHITDTPSFKDAGGYLVDPKLPCCNKYVFGTTDYWQCYAKCMMNSKRNYCGTNAMGSVVDSRLRVKGVNKLRVVDASVIPTITSGDIHLPVIMIGEKSVDIIKEDYKV